MVLLPSDLMNSNQISNLIWAFIALGIIAFVCSLYIEVDTFKKQVDSLRTRVTNEAPDSNDILLGEAMLDVIDRIEILEKTNDQKKDF